MPSENVQNMRRGFEAFARGDMATLAQFIDPEFVVEDRVLFDVSSDARGPDALVDNTDRVREAIGEASWEPREIVDLGDRMLVRVHFEGAGKATALAMEQLTSETDLGQLWTLRDGRAIKLEVFRTWDEARAAAGLED